MIERWYGDAIDLDRVREVDEVTGTPPLLHARHLPSDEASTVDERYHDGEAAGYDAYCRIPRVSAAEGWIVPWIRRHTPVGITIDLGCGTGRVAKALAAPPGRRVIAVDRSVSMLEMARTQVPPSEVVLLRADARALPMYDGSVDTVVCSGVLHHMPTWPDAVREAARVLRPGGRLIVREPNAAYPAWLFAPVEQVLERLARFRPWNSAGGRPGIETAEAALSPVERPIGLPELVQAADLAELRLVRAGTAMLLGSLGVPDAAPAQQLYFRPANLIDRCVLRFTRQPFGAVLLAIFTASPGASTVRGMG